MGKGISISIAADTKDAKRGIQTGLIEPLEDASKALDSLADEGESAGRVLERAFSDQQRETESLRKEYDKLGDQIRTSGRRGRDFGDDVKTGTDKAKRGMDEFGEEANSTARESAASFDGSAESIGDAFQEIAANAFAGFGPAGAAAGLAAALGLGAAMSAITAQQEAVDALREKFAEAYQQAAEDGRTFLDEAQIQAAAIDILFDSTQRKQAMEDAKRLGADMLTTVRATSGDQEALNTIIALGNDKIAEGTEHMRDKADAGKNVFDIETAEVAALEVLVQKYRDQLGVQRENEQAARDVLALQDEASSKQAAGNKAAKDAIDVRGAALQAYADKAASIPNPVLVPRVDTRDAEEDIGRFVRKPRAQIQLEAQIFYKPGAKVLG